MTMLREEVLGLITKNEDRAWTESMAYCVPPNEGKPHVIMIVGVNGVGKTTSIAKLAHRYKSSGLKVMLGAADTFRAAAVEQLQIWGERSGSKVIHKHHGSDAAGLVYDAIKNSITEKIGLSVAIKNNKQNKGTITFSYKEIDQLNKIIQIIKLNY